MDVLHGYRDTHNVSSDSSDSEDSDKECNVWKRAPVKKVVENEISPVTKIEEIAQPVTSGNEQVSSAEPAKPNLKRKRNTIWCDVLQDQLISEDFEDCLLKNKPPHYGSRGKESYDYTLSYIDKRVERDSDSPMSDSTLGEEVRPRKKQRFSGEKKFKKFVKLDNAEIEAARKINKVLNEKKYYLIERIVKFAGIEKAMQLLAHTTEIEENGGMMIKNHLRRRTPGGVYIQLVKSDKEITQEIQDKIFEGEMSPAELKKHYKEQKKNRKKRNSGGKNYKKHNSKGSRSTDMTMDTTESGIFQLIFPEEEASSEMSPEKSNSDDIVPSAPDTIVVSEPVAVKSPPENVSDLEDGEIED